MKRLRAQHTHHTHQSPWKKLAFYSVLVWGGLGLWGCTPNLVVRHNSQTSRPIHVYVNQKLFCVVAPGRTCGANVKQGRHTFFAEIKGTQTPRWASRQRPTPFVVDRQTVIDLHDPKPHPKPSSHHPRSSPQGKTKGNVR